MDLREDHWRDGLVQGWRRLSVRQRLDIGTIVSDTSANPVTTEIRKRQKANGMVLHKVVMETIERSASQD